MCDKTDSNTNKEIVFREPSVEDGKRLWELAGDSKTLDLNSQYFYLLMCRDFHETSVVAERDGQVIGFVIAYQPPESPETIFVWQTAVAGNAQGLGIASAMLKTIITEARLRKQLKFLTASITPSNSASIGLFTSIARKMRAPWAFDEIFFSEDQFAGQDHEAEKLFRIGPIT